MLSCVQALAAWDGLLTAQERSAASLGEGLQVNSVEAMEQGSFTAERLAYQYAKDSYSPSFSEYSLPTQEKVRN